MGHFGSFDVDIENVGSLVPWQQGETRSSFTS